MLKNYSTVILQRSAALGDVIWTTPIFKYMKDSGIEHTVAVTQYTDIFKNNPYVDQVVDLHTPLCDDSEALVLDLDWAYEANRGKHLHMLEAYCDVAGIQFDAVKHTPSLFTTQEDKLWAQEQISRIQTETNCQNIVVFHAAATSPDRIWSIVRWEQLADQLLRRNCSIAVVGANKDFYLQERPGIYNYVGQTSLHQVAALIAEATCFVGPDSGISNVSFTTKTPALVLYGMAEPITRLPKDSEVHKGIVANDCYCLGCLEKLPTQAPPLCTNWERSKCMDMLTVADVFHALTPMLK